MSTDVTPRTHLPETCPTPSAPEPALAPTSTEAALPIDERAPSTPERPEVPGRAPAPAPPEEGTAHAAPSEPEGAEPEPPEPERSGPESESPEPERSEPGAPGRRASESGSAQQRREARSEVTYSTLDRELRARWSQLYPSADSDHDEATSTPAGREEHEPPSSPLDALLRDRGWLLARIERGEALAEIARVMLVTTILGGAAFGAAVGMYRGGVQIAYAAIKLPAAILVTTAVCAPLYTALKRSLQQPASIVEDFALLLSALALACVVTASLAPVLLLAIFQGVSYHALVLLVVSLCGAGGVCGFALFFRGLNQQVRRGKRLICLTFLGVLGLVSAQMSWVARPYLVRPQTEEVPFARAIEGSFFRAVDTSVDSALGIYDRADTLEPRVIQRRSSSARTQRRAVRRPQTQPRVQRAASPEAPSPSARDQDLYYGAPRGGGR